MLEIQNLSVAVANTTIVSSFFMNIKQGSITVLQGANGSGKSSIINALIGHPSYQVIDGDISVDGISIKALAMHERARLGILVIMQQQIAIPGLLVVDYFFQLSTTLYPYEEISMIQIKEKLFWAFDFVGLDRALIEKSVCEGFSGGQKKRFELIHLLLLNPRYIVLDEVDSGLDRDCVELIPNLVQWVKNQRPETGWLFITHNQTLINALCPDQIVTLERSFL
jgi:Fe-S cluster assembly ATP-binding protein